MKVANTELAFTGCWNNLKRYLTVKKSLQDVDAKEMYLLHNNRSFSLQSVEKCNVFIIFECSYDAASKMCRFEFCFQTSPSSNSAGK